MIFENFWPLLFLAAVPIVIILYFFKPKGKDQLISSNLLWRKSLDSDKPDSFLEKFQNNILMYLQILTVIILILALMSPFFYKASTNAGRQILLIDTSASMLQKTSNGKTRFEQGIDEVCSFIDSTDGLSLSIVASDPSGTEILAIDSKNKVKCKEILHSLKPSHGSSNLSEALDTIDKLNASDEQEEAKLMILTDAYGDMQTLVYDKINISKIFLYNEPVNNISNDYTAYTAKENGLNDVIVCCTNYSDFNASFDISLEDNNGNLIDVKHLTAQPGNQAFALFEDISVDTPALKSNISAISFYESDENEDNNYFDSLSEDNISYAIAADSSNINALLISNGNTFIEKAYDAITGEPLSKTESLSETSDYSFAIFDADYSDFCSDYSGSKLIFSASENSAEILSNKLLTFSDSELTNGLKDFSIGVNNAYTYTLPDWAHSFLEYDSKCVGYFGEHDGIREIVVGFDICESDFPLKAEFPIFISNAIAYLSNKSILANNTYLAGETLLINQWANNENLIYNPENKYSGLFSIENDNNKEYYTIRFNTGYESDGRTPENYTPSAQAGDNFSINKVRHFISNILIIIALILLIAEWIIYVIKYRYKKKFYLFVRLILIALLLLALFDVNIPIIGNMTETIFIADVSDSNKDNAENINQYLQNTISKLPHNNRYGIISLGKTAMIEQTISDKKLFSKLMTAPDSSATDFESAIQKAIALFSEGTNKRIVILTDGKETKGNINNLANLIADNNIELLSLKYINEPQNDCYISDVIMPTYLHENENYSLTVVINSNYDTDATISLTNPNYDEQETANVHLNKGTNKFVFNKTVKDSTLENILITVNATDDSCEENNTYNVYSNIENKTKLLVIYDESEDLKAFVNILDASFVDYETVNTKNIPKDINSLLDYKGIITIDVPYYNMPTDFINNLPIYVKEYGCGYICIGGTSSYILGGYKDTILEEILPVDMTPVNEDIKKTLGLIMVIDRSGSMTSPLSEFDSHIKLDSALNAASLAVDTLDSTDYIGVLAFDDDYTWVTNPVQNTNKDAVKSSIRSINEGGGTSIKPALEAAYYAAKDMPTEQKHILLLSDGQDGDYEYNELIKKITYDNISVSTIAIGNDADTTLLQMVSEACKGRFYSVTSSKELPNIFVKEVYLGSNEIIKEGNFPLNVNTSHQLTQNIFPNGWAELNGYISTSIKNMGTEVITTGKKNDPILSTWQYGLGKTVAWTSGIFGEWDANYIQENDYAQLWKNIIDYSCNTQNLGDDSIDIVNSGDKIILTYNAKNYTGKTNIITSMLDPNQNANDITLHPVSPGKYEAEISADKNGLYHFVIQRKEDDKVINSSITASAVQFSDEYKFTITTSAFDNFISLIGTEIDTDYNIWQKISNLNTHSKSIIEFLLILTTVLFILDVTLRRFNITPKMPNAIINIFNKITTPKTKDGLISLTNNTNIHTKAVSNNTNENTSNILINEIPQNEPNIETQTIENSNKKPDKKSNKKSDNNQVSGILDTSTLLKKKDERNNSNK